MAATARQENRALKRSSRQSDLMRVNGWERAQKGTGEESPVVGAFDSPSTKAENGTAPPLRSLRGRLVERRTPLVLTGMVFIVGLLFMFAWNPIVVHNDSWNVGTDLWGIFRGAHFVTWGYLGGVYEPANGVNSFPGMSVILAPVAALSSRLHLSESYSPFILLHPTAALILQPTELLLGSSVIFSCDALGERLGVTRRRRNWTCLVVAIVAWPTVAIWGHAEDLLALSFAVYALIAMFDGRWTKCGWLLGCGIVVQPLVGLLLPLVVAVSPPGKRIVLAIRAAAISAFLLAIAFIGNPSGTYRQVVKQPTPPAVNHPTPWLVLAPRLGTLVSAPNHVERSLIAVHHVFGWTTTSIRGAQQVAAGPGRSIDLALAIAVGMFAFWKRPLSISTTLWLAALVLCSRCFFEAVMTPYYLAPPLILAVAVAAQRSGVRLAAASATALAITVYSYFRFSPWVWWLPIVAAMGVLLALGYPGKSHPEPSTEVVAGRQPTTRPQQKMTVSV
jgi:hypothetical protein